MLINVKFFLSSVPICLLVVLTLLLPGRCLPRLHVVSQQLFLDCASISSSVVLQALALSKWANLHQPFTPANDAVALAMSWGQGQKSSRFENEYGGQMPSCLLNQDFIIITPL